MIPGILLTLVLGASACQTITTDHIYGRDLALVLPVFRTLPENQVVGLSPFPGQQRVFRPNELARIAAANDIDEHFESSVCFSWPMSVPTVDKMRAAMQKTLAGRNAQIEFVEQSLAPAPPGEMTFAQSGLSGNSDGPVLWRGTVAYAENRIFTIWARVRVTVKEPRVVAVESLHAGEEIRPEQIRLTMYEGPLSRESIYGALQDVVGLTPKNAIGNGQTLTQSMLRQRSEVERGDLVKVLVQMQSAHVEAQGIAEESGRRGSVITVRNVRSGRKFRARIEDKGQVLVMPNGPTGLVVEEAGREASE